MRYKYKVFLIFFCIWLAFAFLMLLINQLFFQVTTLENIKIHLLISIILILLFTVFSLWLGLNTVTGEITELKKNLKAAQDHFNLSHSAKTYNHEKIKLSHYDLLTSLPNSMFFNEILNKTISQAKRHNKQFALLILDLDHFKFINDSYGEKLADQAIQEVSHRFQSALRAGDTIARYSGDEFIILLDDINHPKFASPVAEKILQFCSQDITIKKNKITLTASIGIAIFPSDGESMQELESHAEVAMYKVKRAGGNGFQYYRHEMDAAAREHMKLETALHLAIERNEFELYYQPQLSLEDGNIRSVEALIRWNHPELGLIKPEKFISLAEESDLIKQIGKWALHEAVRTNKSWQTQGYAPIVVAVNISPRQFLHQDMAKIIKEILDEYSLDAKYLEIEITESLMMQDMAKVALKLNEIHALGVRIAVDDFGTGYTSINYLKQFPLSSIKIDQTFIKGIPYNQNDAAITSSIIALGHNLGLEVIAEGVETTEQIQYLAMQKCDLIQGYFLSRPMPQHKIILQFCKRGNIPISILKK